MGKRALVLAPLGAAAGYVATPVVQAVAPYGVKALAAGAAGLGAFMAVGMTGAALGAAVGWALKSENAGVYVTGAGVVGGIAAGLVASGLAGAATPLLARPELGLLGVGAGAAVGLATAYLKSRS